MRYVLFFAALSLYAADAPVLAELFTSEGCSSCPPADALLMKLDRMQPVPGVHIIVLSEHVDYWNSAAWTDPFSSAQFSQRQEAFARTLKDESYTPQLIVDGRASLVGNQERNVLAAVSKAAANPKVDLRIDSVERAGRDAVVHVSVPATSQKAALWIAIADERDQSSVRGGENSGRTMSHVAVVRSLTQAATVGKDTPFEKTLRVPLGAQSGPLRVVAFLAAPNGAVLGVTLKEQP